MNSENTGEITVGSVFARLTAVEKVGYRRWKFRCIEGNEVVHFNSDVISGKVKSCGCLLREMREQGQTGRTTHGLYGHPLMPTWKQMRAKVHNPKDKTYPQVGGKGIGIDPRWDDFATFAADVGERPEGARFKRKDVTKDYGPTNWHWVTR